MMDFVLKYRWALAGTIFLHLVFFVSAFNIKVSQPPFKASGLTRIPVLLAPQEPEEKLTEEEKKQLAQNHNSEKVMNETFNETDKRGESDKKYDARNYKNVNEQVDENVKELERQYFEELASKRKEDINIKKDKTKDDPKIKTDEPLENGENSSKTLKAGSVTSSYDLGGRTHERIAKPSYVCKGGGTVVLNIEVDRSGRVTNAKIDDRASSYREACMGENAIKYAMKCKFVAGTQYNEPHKGTITYVYVPQ